METCSFSDFMQILKPWLNRDYVRKAYLDADGNFRLMFVDGGENAYRIDDVIQAQLADALRLLQENNIPVEKDTAGSG